MKCTNKLKYALFAALLTMSITGCTAMQQSAMYSFSTSTGGDLEETIYPTFASDLCVVDSDITGSGTTLYEHASAGLFDLTNRQTLYAKDVNLRLHPASLTKVMTALVALKYGSLDQVLVAGPDVYVNESGAQKIGLKEGDRLTLDQALRILLVYSANDVANLIASNIGGSIGEFTELMNKEALSIGATNSHFVNPNGLTADEHYVSAYDMYLIFNAAMKYDTFCEIINTSEYTTSYLDSSGASKEVSVSNTNAYLRGDKEMPTGVTVIGGKTGTTQAAGHCLILLARNTRGNPYIAVILRDSDVGSLYDDMSALLNEIVN